jgi:hypothetical protein
VLKEEELKISSKANELAKQDSGDEGHAHVQSSQENPSVFLGC